VFEYVLRRLIASIPTLLGVLAVVFFVVHLIPGDPVAAMLGDTATAEQLALTREQYGFDRPLHEQFLIFLRNYGAGNMGTSIRTRRPVVQEITSRFHHTLQLAVGGVLIAVLLGVPLGVVAAVRRGSLIDLLSLVVSTAGVAAPIFWIGLLLSLLFATNLGWFPSIGAGRPGDLMSVLRALVLPSLSLGLAGMALIARMTRSSMLEVLREDYIRTAKAKGLRDQIVVYKHALKNAANPIITIVGLNFGYLLGGTVLIETVFARPGIGRLLVDAILARDYPVVQGVTFVIATSFILVNLITDVVYSLVDPRVRVD
jgi:ABC-type dipeptide/oligopeptide/nickel transport system permease component